MTFDGNPIAEHPSGGQTFWTPTPSLGNSGDTGPDYLDRSLVAVRYNEGGGVWIDEPARAPTAGSSLNGYTVASFNGSSHFLYVPADLVHHHGGYPDWFYVDIQNFLWDRGLQYPDYWDGLGIPDSTDLRRDDLADASSPPDELPDPPVGLGLQRTFTFILLIKPASAAAPNTLDGDAQILCDDGGFYGVNYTTDGVTAWCYVDGDQVSVTAACPTGEWSLVEVRFKGPPDGSLYATHTGEFSIRVSSLSENGDWETLGSLNNDLGFTNASLIVGCNLRGGNGVGDFGAVDSAYFHGEIANISTAAKWWSDSDLNRFRVYLNNRYATTFATE